MRARATGAQTMLLVCVIVSVAAACRNGGQPTPTAPVTVTGVATGAAQPQTTSEMEPVPRTGPSLTRLPARAQISETGLYIYDVDSGSVWKTSFNSGWSWAPDRELLAATTRYAVGHYALYIADVNAGVSILAYETTAPSEGEGSIQGLRWSPDAGSLAFIVGDDVVSVVRRDGTGIRQFLLAGLDRMRWSEDNHHLVLELFPQPAGGSAEYAVVDAASGQIGRFQDQETIDGIAPATFFAETSSDGAWVQIQGGIQNLRTGEARRIPGLTYVEWAPAGPAFVYFEGKTAKAFAARLDSDQVAELTNLGAGLVWSPDGRRIAYTSFSCDESSSDWDIYVSAWDGSDERRFTFDPGRSRHEIHWSPDGRKLVFAGSHLFAQDGERTGLLMLDVESTELTLIAEASETFRDLHSEWSPSGRYIAFSPSGGHGDCH